MCVDFYSLNNVPILVNLALMSLEKRIFSFQNGILQDEAFTEMPLKNYVSLIKLVQYKMNSHVILSCAFCFKLLGMF